MKLNHSRLTRVKEKMDQMTLDHLIVTSPDAIFYLIDKEIHPGERLLALLISPKSCTLVMSALFPMESTEDLKVLHFDDTEDSIQLLANEMNSPSRIGIDKEWPSRFLLSLMDIMPKLEYINGSAAIDDVRLCKDDAELERMRKASIINDQVMQMVMDYIQVNASKMEITEQHMQKKVIEFNESFGVTEMSFTPTICFGKNGAEPHHDCDQTVLKWGDSIVVDIGNRKDGYCSDMTRSFIYGVGAVDVEYQTIYQLVKDANQAAIECVRPGVPLKDVDQAARAVIESAGYGEYFTHRTGHGIGINVHEFPDVSSTSENVCLPGMVFSIEPGIYLLGKFGVRIEDLVVVTETGCEVLNQVNKALIQLN